MGPVWDTREQVPFRSLVPLIFCENKGPECCGTSLLTHPRKIPKAPQSVRLPAQQGVGSVTNEELPLQPVGNRHLVTLAYPLNHQPLTA